MKIAVVGSRDLNISEAILKEYLFGASEIVSGGAGGWIAVRQNIQGKTV